MRRRGQGLRGDDLRKAGEIVQAAGRSKPFQAGFLGVTYPQSAGQFGDGKGAMMLMLNGLLGA